MFEGEEITALQRDGDLTLAIGTSEGNLKLFDLRYPTPFLAKQHPYMEPINDICFHQQSHKMLVSDEKSIRVYDRPSYNLFTAVESKFKIHGVKPFLDSGLLLVPQEARRIGTYFIPALGVAPKWCSFIENMTEELEEKQTETIYNEYKFLTREEVDAISASNLIGTKFLQSYMNGFIMKAKLYNKMKDQSQPFDYQAYKEDMIKTKLNKELLKDKIFKKTAKAQVNQKLIENVKKNVKDTPQAQARAKLLQDDRFKELIENEDFEKDETHEEFLLRNPSAAANLKKKKLGRS